MVLGIKWFDLKWLSLHNDLQGFADNIPRKIKYLLQANSMKTGNKPCYNEVMQKSVSEPNMMNFEAGELQQQRITPTAAPDSQK